jgi:hypothetical protein
MAGRSGSVQARCAVRATGVSVGGEAGAGVGPAEVGPAGQAGAVRDSICSAVDTRPEHPSGTASMHHTTNAVAYIRRFRRWLPRFLGVATRYLSHYLAWHGLLEGQAAWPTAMLCAAGWPVAG